MPRIHYPALLLCGLLLAGSASADDRPPPPADGDMPPAQGQSHEGHQPPPEAFAACVGKHPGDKVLIQLHGQSINAHCVDFHGRLAARPDQPPPPPRQ